MAETDIAAATTSDLQTTQKDFSVASETLDSQTAQKENKYVNQKWSQYLGYYEKIPELKRAINIIATWTIGKGFTASPEIEFILARIRGCGSDSFNTILENMIRVMWINGDSFAEIIRDPETKFLINLKPLDPSQVEIVTDKRGLIERYDLLNQFGKATTPFKPEQILHFSKNRVGNETHGNSIIKELELIILARAEAFADWKRVMHRNVNPVRIWHMDSDDVSTIATFKSKVETAVKDAENIFIPQGNVEVEVSSISPNQTLNGMTWMRELNNYFYESSGIPEIVAGSGKQFTDASSKIKYLVWQQTIEEEQLFVEEQLGLQLGIEINLIFPASLEKGIVQEQQKEGELQAVRPNDVVAELEGAT